MMIRRPLKTTSVLTKKTGQQHAQMEKWQMENYHSLAESEKFAWESVSCVKQMRPALVITPATAMNWKMFIHVPMSCTPEGTGRW